ncbi:hypothetical protein [Lacipirellula sp.]|uniref:hypothetical protein n=1 Tax=Lacipirellula sp. TaxID=2691419 RepID=UPI003D12CD3E
MPTSQIARQLGIGERTVRVIKSGTHFTQVFRDELKHWRCPGCGGLVEKFPCMLCEMRKAGL